MPDSGMGMPSFCMILRKRSRSSARSMVSGVVPRICTPASASSRGDVERRLAAELDDHPLGLLLLVDAEHILDGQRLEVELVGGVVVGGDRLGVAVDHDGLVARLAEGEGGVHAAVVELDALADPVGAAAEDHDLPAVADGHAVRRVVGGVVVGGVLHPADRHGLPGLRPRPGACAARGSRPPAGPAAAPGSGRQNPSCLAWVSRSSGSCRPLAGEDLLLQLDQLLHLLDEPGLDVGQRVELLDVGALAQRLVHDELALAGRLGQHAPAVPRADCSWKSLAKPRP